MKGREITNSLQNIIVKKKKLYNEYKVVYTSQDYTNYINSKSFKFPTLGLFQSCFPNL